jgi:hypothetical protein
MTGKERKEFITFMEEFTVKVTSSQELSRQFLVDVGIYTADGQLTEPYKNLYIPRSSKLAKS